MPSFKTIATIAVVSAGVYFGLRHYETVKGGR